MTSMPLDDGTTVFMVAVTVNATDLHDESKYNQIAEAFKTQAHLDLNQIRANDLENGIPNPPIVTESNQD